MARVNRKAGTRSPTCSSQ